MLLVTLRSNDRLRGLSLRDGSLVHLITTGGGEEEIRYKIYVLGSNYIERAQTLAESLVVGGVGYSQLEEVLHTEDLIHKEVQALERRHLSVKGRADGQDIRRQLRLAYCY